MVYTRRSTISYSPIYIYMQYNGLFKKKIVTLGASWPEATAHAMLLCLFVGSSITPRYAPWCYFCSMSASSHPCWGNHNGHPIMVVLWRLINCTDLAVTVRLRKGSTSLIRRSSTNRASIWATAPHPDRMMVGFVLSQIWNPTYVSPESSYHRSHGQLASTESDIMLAWYTIWHYP